MALPTWKEKLNSRLIQQAGKKNGSILYKKYADAFDAIYSEECAPDLTASDINYLEKITPTNFLELDFYLAPEKQQSILHLRIYKRDTLIALSDLLPILGDLDFRAWSERTYKVNVGENVIWISDIIISYARVGEFNFVELRHLFRDAFIEIFTGHFESDGFNKLILGAQLSWREIVILRAYAKYLRQVGFHFSQVYIEQALSNNAPIVKNLIALFNAKQDPARKLAQKNQAVQLEEDILAALDKVISLDEDLILRRYLALIKATLRTNYFQMSSDGKAKSYLSFKFLSAAIPELPLPVPFYEIFIYAARFEGIHLRGSKVARGGIRWSNRREDFRREILGLMKAQRVKNAIIVPSGAKGGFVLKTLAATASRDEVQKEVVACYQLFIRGLLDLTDNIIEGKPVHPHNIVCHDDSDPYLVVAADKGTSSFSDIANSISQEYQFWLGDAFASGGMTGYDHKKIGITARGAWESVKRHFRALDININNTLVTLVGIGDMSGDVFGNGLIYSKKLKLVAAFDNRNIFLDPNPNPDISYQERLRLFKLPSSSWEDYNSKFISKGGGVYKLSAKSIPISAEVKKILAIKDDALVPYELIRAILKAPVDLLWNGGIGTYVKATTESHADVGDKTNDANRVNGEELRCKVVGEGGNLGFTQRGRIEYALNKGLINTDFIDNSAGVDCSDHEVNLKILLNSQVNKNKLTEKKRNQLLAEVTPEIAALVLKDNYNQAWIMGFVTAYSYRNTALYQGYIKELETLGHLDRQVEFLPEDKTILERKAAGIGLTSPELAVLLAYTKIYIKNELLKSVLPEEPYFAQIIETAFPATINKIYHKASQEHILHREIVATQLSNRVVNEMGISFVYRIQTESGASVTEVVRAYVVASAVFDSLSTQTVIEDLDFKIPISSQYDLLYYIRHLINISTRWFLYEDRLNGGIPKIIEHYSTRVKKLEELILELMTGYTKTFLEKLTDEFSKAGLTQELAKHIASYRVVYTALNIIEVATKNNFDLIRTGKLYFTVGQRLNLVWFRDYIANDVREGSWNAMARMTLRDDLDTLQKALTVEILKYDKKEEDMNKLISLWSSKNERPLDRFEKMVRSLHENATIDYSMFFIVLRELANVVRASKH